MIKTDILKIMQFERRKKSRITIFNCIIFIISAVYDNKIVFMYYMLTNIFNSIYLRNL